MEVVSSTKETVIYRQLCAGRVAWCTLLFQMVFVLGLSSLLLLALSYSQLTVIQLVGFSSLCTCAEGTVNTSNWKLLYIIHWTEFHSFSDNAVILNCYRGLIVALSLVCAGLGIKPHTRLWVIESLLTCEVYTNQDNMCVYRSVFLESTSVNLYF